MFCQLCEVLRGRLAEYEYPGDFLAAADLEACESEAMAVADSLDAADVAGLSDCTRICVFTEMLRRNFVRTIIAICLGVFVASVPEMVLDEIFTADFEVDKEEAIYNAGGVLVNGLETGAKDATESG